MSGDFSRLSFDPKRHYSGVLLQQGRVLTDADWNDQTALVERRIRVGSLDTFGHAVVPRTTPEGFNITLDRGQIAIGRGRMYVDGLLVENHGSAAARTTPRVGAPTRLVSRLPFLRAGSDAWDAALAESYGTAPTLFTAQPFMPIAAEVPRAGSWVAYLDVWQREVSHLQDPDLVEKALGVDTTNRLQTVWQVKLHEVARATAVAGATCANALDNDAAWAALTAASSSRLTTATATVPGEPDPCLMPPGAGYRGLENQLYRVEIHRGGTAGNATFKWSRDNASIETRVARIVDGTHLIVDSIGKDGVLCFSDGDWVEITDEARDLSGQAGELRRIRAGGGVDHATRQLTLDGPALSATEFAPGAPDPARALRVRRWDQKGRVRRADGTLHADIDTSGAIPVPAAGTAILLENGVTVSFSLQAGGSGRYRAGEWWVFAARAADASIEELNAAPPRGPHHHYAKLAVIAFPDRVEDCRVSWPPQQQAGEGCACTVCVSPASHADGSMTIQQAISEVQRRGGGTVCLDVGQYRLAQPLRVEGARSLRLRGQGSATVLIAPVEALRIRQSDDVVLEDLTLRALDETPAPAPSAGGVPGSTAPTARRPAGLRTTGEVQLLNSVSTRTARSNLSLRRVALEDRRRLDEAPVGAPAAAPAAAPEPEGLVRIDDAREVALKGLWLDVRNVGDSRDEDAGTTVAGIALLVRGAAPGLRVEHCRIVAPLGVVALDAGDAVTGGTTTAPRPIVDASCVLRDNRFECGFAALMQMSDALGTRLCVEDNVLDCERYGLMIGRARTTRIEVRGNDIRAGVAVLATHAALLSIEGNLLRGSGAESVSGGILMMGAGRDARWGLVDVRDNLFGGIRGIAVGVAGEAAGMSLRVSGNRLSNVGRGVVFADYETVEPGRGRFDPEASEPARSICLENNEITTLPQQGDPPAGDGLPEPLGLALRAEHVRISGNSVEGGTSAPLIGVDASAHCELSSNCCENRERGTLPDVHVRCAARAGSGTIIAGSNRLAGPRELALVLETPPMGERPRCTVLGNISRGDILVVGLPMPAPVEQFNIIGA